MRLAREFAVSLLSLDTSHPDSRLDHQIRKLGPRAARIEVEDARVVLNLNTPADLAFQVSATFSEEN